mmetsp:Transcript_124537/g.265524  ORF Transcript_124537/g.265524 Transcript_124537/m.265524 type:complete len:226 (+) Transcript_124537:2216-2893(+)
MRQDPTQARIPLDKASLDVVAHWEGKQAKDEQGAVHDAINERDIELHACNLVQGVLGRNRQEGTFVLNILIGRRRCVKAPDSSKNHKNAEKQGKAQTVQHFQGGLLHSADHVQGKQHESQACNHSSNHMAAKAYWASGKENHHQGQEEAFAPKPILVSQFHGTEENPGATDMHTLHNVSWLEVARTPKRVLTPGHGLFELLGFLGQLWDRTGLELGNRGRRNSRP